MSRGPWVAMVSIAVASVLVAGPVAAAAPARNDKQDQDTKPGKKPTLEAKKKKKADRSKAYTRAVKLSIADIQDYWDVTFPAVYGAAYQRIPANRIFAARPGVKLPACQGHKLTYSDAEENAFYCFKTNYVAYDDVKLFPELYRDFGDFSIALMLAHEWGHAIQDRSDNAEHPSIQKELQADCFAGGWVRHVSDGESDTISLEPGSLDTAIGALLRFRDPTGSSSEDASAHGDAFDRINAFQDGYGNGPSKCATYFDDPPLTTEQQFTSQDEADNGGNMAAGDVIPVSVDLLNDFYSQVDADYTPLTIDSVYKYDSTAGSDQLPECGGSTPRWAALTNRVFYCIDDGYIAFDEPYVQHVYDDIGDFGVATLFASTWATFVQTQQDFPGVADNTDAAVLAADCYTGGFASAMYRELLTTSDGNTISLSSGDLDETVQALLDYTAARGVGHSADATFELLGAFRGGFFDGYNSCANYAETDPSLARS